MKKVLLESQGCKYVEIRTRVRISTYFWRLFAVFFANFFAFRPRSCSAVPEAATLVGLIPCPCPMSSGPPKNSVGNVVDCGLEVVLAGHWGRSPGPLCYTRCREKTTSASLVVVAFRLEGLQTGLPCLCCVGSNRSRGLQLGDVWWMRCAYPPYRWAEP